MNAFATTTSFYRSENADISQVRILPDLWLPLARTFQLGRPQAQAGEGRSRVQVGGRGGW